MKLIILAAGKGSRLLPLTRNTPKSLLEIGNGMTVLESQLAVAASCGINNVVIVTGYKTEQIEAKIKDYTDFNINIFYNPFFDSSNNLVSAWMAKSEMTDDFIVVNGDVIFNNNVLTGLLKNKNDICITIHQKAGYDPEDMKVIAADGLINKVSKEIPVSEANGESIGMLKFMGKGRTNFVLALDRLVRQKEYLKAFLPSALQNLSDHGFPVNYFECDSKDWTEIDFISDLENAKKYVLNYLS